VNYSNPESEELLIVGMILEMSEISKVSRIVKAALLYMNI